MEKYIANKKQFLKYRKIVHGYGLYILFFLSFLLFSPYILYKIFGFKVTVFIILILEIGNIIFIIIEKFNRQEDNLSWALLVLLLPFFGGFLFLFFTFIQKNRKIFIEKQMKDRKFLFSSKIKNIYVSDELIQLSNSSYQVPLIREEFYNDLIDELHRSKYSINIQMYIVRYDVITEKIFKKLIEKSKQGIKVRLLIDVCGSIFFPSKYLYKLSKNRIEISFFNQNKSTFFDTLYVNHRKKIIIDGKIAYTGGFNFGREYIYGYESKQLKWFDLMVKLKGNIVNCLQNSFILDWCFSTNEIYRTFYIDKEKYFYEYEYPIFNKKSYCKYILGGADRQINTIVNELKKLIDNTQSSLFFTTPYFIPCETIIKSLMQALDRGVDIRIIIPEKPDKKLVYYCTKAHINHILNYGAKVYKYDNYFVHSKIYIFDKKTVLYGTVNMDMRSFYLNFEEMIVSYNDETLNYKLMNIFETLLKSSSKVNFEMWKRKKITIKFLEIISIILKPIF